MISFLKMNLDSDSAIHFESVKAVEFFKEHQFDPATFVERCIDMYAYFTNERVGSHAFELKMAIEKTMKGIEGIPHSIPESIRPMLDEMMRHVSNEVLAQVMNASNPDMNDLKSLVQEIAHRLGSSKGKGTAMEAALEVKIQQLFPGCQLDNVTTTHHNADLLLKIDDVEILIETKSAIKSVDPAKFKADLRRQKRPGIILSHQSGIIGHGELDFGLIDVTSETSAEMTQLPVVFVPNCAMDDIKIKVAVEFVRMTMKMLKTRPAIDGIVLQTDDMQKIILEYRDFLKNRDETMKKFEAFAKSHVKELKDFSLHQLSAIFAQHGYSFDGAAPKTTKKRVPGGRKRIKSNDDDTETSVMSSSGSSPRGPSQDASSAAVVPTEDQTRVSPTATDSAMQSSFDNAYNTFPG